MLGNFTGWHLIIVLFIVLLLFGAPKLPALARSVGQSMKIFRSEIKTPEAGKADLEADARAAELRAAELKVEQLRVEQLRAESAVKPGDTSAKS